MFANDLSDLLHYKLLMEKHIGYTAYMDVSEDLSDRIQKNLYRFTTFNGFCDLLKTKDLAYSRISRCLLHILLDIKKSDVSMYVNELGYTPYARILGFRREATPLLSEISKKTQIPLISKLADAGKALEGPALEMLQKDIFCSDVYSSLRCRKNEIGMKNEYSTPIVIV
jgi:predicted nucleotidyltransferase